MTKKHKLSGAQKVFAESLEKSIKFHMKNQNDPHGVSNAVIVALGEVYAAFMAAYDTKPKASK